MKQTNPYDLIKEAGLKPDELGEQGLKVLSIYDDAAKMLEKRPNDTSVKETTTKTFTKVESAIKKIIKAVQEKKKTAADKEAEAKLKKENSSMTMKEINAGLDELAECDAELKRLKKAKREKSGKKPKQKTRYTKLKEKLLSVITLIPDNLKNDLKVQQQTEKILLSTHRELVKAWGMNKVTAKAGEKAIKEKFDDMEEKANPKPAEKKSPEKKPAAKPKTGGIIELEIMYRDGANYKTFFSHEVDLEKFPKAKDLKVGDELTMGEYGTLSEKDFFDSETHPHAYDDEHDHNLLEITEIKK